MTRRIESLDAVRGIASLVVVLHHCAMTVPGLREWFQASIVLRPLVAGPSAVLIFFVLSGFVLYLALEQRDGFRYLPYIAKRVMRIYPPLVFAIALSTILYVMVTPTPVEGLSSWFNVLSWGSAPDSRVVLGHLLLLDGTDYQGFNNVIWSLVHEMRILFVFPLIALAVRRSTPVALAAALVLSVLGMHLAQPTAARTTVDLFATLQYVFLFTAGAALAKHADAIRAWAAAPGRRAVGPSVLLLGIATGMMAQRTSAIGAILLVGVCFSYPPLVRALSRPAFTWLGRVSYSLYLTHLLVILTLFHVLHGHVPTAAILAAVLPTSLAVAALCHRFVEMPAIALGRLIAEGSRPAPTVRAEAAAAGPMPKRRARRHQQTRRHAARRKNGSGAAAR